MHVGEAGNSGRHWLSNCNAQPASTLILVAPFAWHLFCSSRRKFTFTLAEIIVIKYEFTQRVCPQAIEINGESTHEQKFQFGSCWPKYLEIFDGVKLEWNSLRLFFLSSAYFAVYILCICMVNYKGHKSKKGFSQGFKGSCPSTACHVVVISSETLDFFLFINLFAFGALVQSSHPQQTSYIGSVRTAWLRIICEGLEKNRGINKHIIN